MSSPGKTEYPVPISAFSTSLSEMERRNMSKKIRESGTTIPVIIQSRRGDTDTKTLKFMVRGEYTMEKFIKMFKSNANITYDIAISIAGQVMVLQTGNLYPDPIRTADPIAPKNAVYMNFGTITMCEIYDQMRSTDGFLYVFYEPVYTVACLFNHGVHAVPIFDNGKITNYDEITVYKVFDDNDFNFLSSNMSLYNVYILRGITSVQLLNGWTNSKCRPIDTVEGKFDDTRFMCIDLGDIEIGDFELVNLDKIIGKESFIGMRGNIFFMSPKRVFDISLHEITDNSIISMQIEDYATVHGLICRWKTSNAWDNTSDVSIFMFSEHEASNYKMVDASMYLRGLENMLSNPKVDSTMTYNKDDGVYHSPLKLYYQRFVHV